MCNLSKTKREFDQFSDSELIGKIQYNSVSSNDAMDILIERYSKIIQYKACDYHIYGFEHDDLVQEGLIGLLNAIRKYNSERESSFKTFANICIDNQLKKLVAHATSNKYKMLTGSLSLTEDLESSELDDPERIFAGKESLRMITERSNLLLSAFERKVIILFLEGYDYNKIAKSLDASPKSVDNALQRVRKKLRSIVGNPD